MERRKPNIALEVRLSRWMWRHSKLSHPRSGTARASGEVDAFFSVMCLTTDVFDNNIKKTEATIQPNDTCSKGNVQELISITVAWNAAFH